MPLFRLERYPFVCRLCLKPEQHRKMTSLDAEDESFGSGTYADFLTKITFAVEEEKRHLFPRSICPSCKELLKMFGRFHSKVQTVHLFMNALVELRDFNTKPARKLFLAKQSRKTVRNMLLELGVCQSEKVRAQDLVDEFPQFNIATLPVTLRNGHSGGGIKMEVDVEPNRVEEPEEDELFAEECSPEELIELTGSSVHHNVKTEQTESPEQQSTAESGVQWELIDDSDEELDVPNKVSKSNRLVPKVKPEPKRKIIDWDTVIANPPSVETIRKDTKAVLASRKWGSAKVDEPLQCPKCPFKTLFKSNFHSHQINHLVKDHKRRPCKEPGCTAEFTDRRALAAHVETKHRLWICESCGQKCSTRSYLAVHIQRYHSTEEATFGCEYCQQKFKIKSDVLNHVKRAHMLEKVFKCGTCGLEFNRKCTLVAHEARHRDVYDFPCQQCDKKFKIASGLARHVQRAHKEPTFACEYCSKMFYTRGVLLDHIECVHKIQMRFVCDICIARFDSQEKLDSHKVRHENPKMYECARCLTVSSTQKLHFDHLCITYREDYVCCGRDFRDHVPFNRHMFLRHGAKVNVRVKPDPGILVGQMRASRKRVEICQKCDASFPTRILKRQHQETCLAGEITF